MPYSGERLRIARQRRGLSGKQLAEKAGLTPVTISKAENGHHVEEATFAACAAALDYPIEFFLLDAPQQIPAETVSFRSLAKMGAAERDAALAAGTLGVELYEWVSERFNLPAPDLIDLSKERDRPYIAARLLRQHWGLGDRPIGNMLALLESKGVRVLSLAENTKNVDAYSFWKAEHPYVFLNQEKTPERSIFDSAHELGHLVMHHHAGAKYNRDAECQADAFASAFLMPEADVMNEICGVSTASQVIRHKSRWRVSAMALAYRLHKLSLISEWTYRSICIELGKLGYRSAEPTGIKRETSVVWEKVLLTLWNERVTKADIATELRIPYHELEALMFELAGPKSASGNNARLRLVH
ncbi:ImmA/IrrE family metallo-endopeptidase [Erythrobacter sp. JK5]|uniref:helix-turn-helix domain-containing protein n=1 Tax=Erythrobacter sp. JK5 TaxID=2829500 RepID=UPI001BA83CEC|nr:XRE family transcriptional regulator [Erythrobacter sp. JK5]QUL38374.1 XRE family transcriptional regulator [Erythrobacter sp. JK5]